MKAATPSITLREIAAECGVTTSAVWKALNPDITRKRNAVDRAKRLDRRREVDRDYRERMRAPCAVCGQPCGVGTGRPYRAVKDRHCADCWQLDAEVRAALLVGMYNDGWPLKDIADAFGVTNVAPELDRLRKAGRIGYRYAGCAQKVAA